MLLFSRAPWADRLQLMTRGGDPQLSGAGRYLALALGGTALYWLACVLPRSDLWWRSWRLTSVSEEELALAGAIGRFLPLAAVYAVTLHLYWRYVF